MGSTTNILLTIVIIVGIILLLPGTQLPTVTIPEDTSGDLFAGNYLKLKNGFPYNPDQWPEWFDAQTAGAVYDMLAFLAQSLTERLGERLLEQEERTRNIIEEDTKKTLDEKTKASDEKIRGDADEKTPRADGDADAESKAALDEQAKASEERVRGDTDEKTPRADVDVDAESKAALNENTRSVEDRVRGDTDEKTPRADVDVDAESKASLDKQRNVLEDRVRGDTDEKTPRADVDVDAESKASLDKQRNVLEERVRADADEKTPRADVDVDAESKAALDKQRNVLEDRVRGDTDEKTPRADVDVDAESKAALDEQAKASEERVRGDADEKTPRADGDADAESKAALDEQAKASEERVRGDTDEKTPRADVDVDAESKAALNENTRSVEDRVRGDTDEKTPRADVDVDAESKASLDKQRNVLEDRVRGDTDEKTPRADVDVDAESKASLDKQRNVLEERVRADADEKTPRADVDVDAESKAALDKQRNVLEDRVRGDTDEKTPRADVDVDAESKAALDEQAKASEERVRGDTDEKTPRADVDVDAESKAALDEQAKASEERVRGDTDEKTPRADVDVDAESKASLDKQRNVLEDRVRGDTDEKTPRADGDVDAESKASLDKQRNVLEDRVRGDTDEKTPRADVDVDAESKASLDKQRNVLEEKVRADTDEKTPRADVDVDAESKAALDEQAKASEEKVRADTDEKTPRADVDVDAESKASLDKQRNVLEDRVRGDTDEKTPRADGDVDAESKASLDKQRNVLEERVRGDTDEKTPRADVDVDAETKASLDKQRNVLEERVRGDTDEKTPRADVDVDAETKASLDKQRNVLEERVRGDTDEKTPRADVNVDAESKASLDKQRNVLEDRVRGDTDEKTPRADVDVDAETKASLDKQRNVLEERVRGDTDEKTPRADVDVDAESKASLDKQRNVLEEKVRDTSSIVKGDNTDLKTDAQTNLNNKSNIVEENVRADTNKNTGLNDTLNAETRASLDKQRNVLEEKVRGDTDKNTPRADVNVDAESKAAMNKQRNVLEEKVRDTSSMVKGDNTDLKTDAQTNLNNKPNVIEENTRKPTSDNIRDSNLTVDQNAKSALNTKVREMENKVRSSNDNFAKKSATAFETRAHISSARVADILERRTFRNRSGRIKDLGPTVHLPYDGRAYLTFGHLPTPKMSKRIGRGFSSYAARQFSTARRSLNDTVKLLNEEVGPKVISKGQKVAGQVLDLVAGDMLDVLGIFTVITDGFFNFPDESEFINSNIVYRVKRQSIRLQLETMRAYNMSVDSENTSRTDGAPKPYAQYPHITGPLDKLDPATQDPYSIQTRAQYEVDRVRLKLLTTTGGTNNIKLINYIGQSLYNTYSSITDFTKKTLLAYVDGQTFTDEYGNVLDDVPAYFTADESDQLYREAFTAVCTYNGGVVYEDRQPVQIDPKDPGMPTMSWRARFQCGWASKGECDREANNWYNGYKKGVWVPGDYAEWFEFDDPDLINLTSGIVASTNYQSATDAIYKSGDTYTAGRDVPSWFDVSLRYTHIQVDETNFVRIVAADSVYLYCKFVGSVPIAYSSATSSVILTNTNIKFGRLDSGEGFVAPSNPLTGNFIIKKLQMAPKSIGEKCYNPNTNLSTSVCAPGYTLQQSESCYKAAYEAAALTGAIQGVLFKTVMKRGTFVSTATGGITTGSLIPEFRSLVTNTHRCKFVKSTDLSTTYPPLVPVGSKLRKDGKTGACIVTNPGFRSMCEYGKGTYDLNIDTRCRYTVKFCQTVGMCFNTTTSLCELPSGKMFAATFLFGEGGPRAWIKSYGCIIGSTSDMEMSNDNMRTADGRRMLSDVLANAKKWPENVKRNMQDPGYAAMNASSVGVLGRIPSLARFAGALGNISLACAVVGALQVATSFYIRRVGNNLENTDDPREYAIGGFITTEDGADRIPATPTFERGWLTKPLDFKPDNPNTKFRNISEYPEFQNYKVPISFLKARVATNLEMQYCSPNYSGGITIGAIAPQDQNACWQNLGEIEDTGTSVGLYFFKYNIATHPLDSTTVFMSMTAGGDGDKLYQKYGVGKYFYLDSTGLGNNYRYRFRFESRTETELGGAGGNFAAGSNWRQVNVWRSIDYNIHTNYTWIDARILNDSAQDGWSFSYYRSGLFGSNTNGTRMSFNILDGVPLMRIMTNATQNALWCIPQKPWESYADPAIGKLVPETTLKQNRSWTDGASYETPAYPIASLSASAHYTAWDDANCNALSNCPVFDSSKCTFSPGTRDVGDVGPVYYQLVYDPKNMTVGSTTASSASMSSDQQTLTVTSTDGFGVGAILTEDSATALGIQKGTVKVTEVVSPTQLKISYPFQSTTRVTNVTIKTLMPGKLWDTTYLKKYFYDFTINEMRQYYCLEAFAADMTGETLDQNCFAYVNVRTTNYVLLPQTIKP